MRQLEDFILGRQRRQERIPRAGHIEVAYVRKCAGMGRGRVDERRIERADAQTERFADETDGACDRLCSTAATSPGYRA